MKMINRKVTRFLTASAVALSMAAASIAAHAEDMLRPYINMMDGAGDYSATVDKARSSLQAGGFTIAGEYSPYDGVHIIAVTNDELKSNAAKSEMGGFGAIQRVAITKVNGNVQISSTNPRYMANVYRMAGDLSGVTTQLTTALGGSGKEFGTAKGHSADDLRKYHYKIMMPYFDDPYELAEFDSQEEAIKAVEDGLAAKKGGASKVYRIDIPGKQESVIGVAMSGAGIECSGDKYIMDRIDGEALRGTPHLPYEMLVSEGKVLSLHPKFRIAQSFPDLSMMAGDYTFFNIMCAPGAIEDVFLMVVGEN